MKKCRNCGADLPEGASFCPHCAQSQIERQEVKPPRLWRKKALIAALCALVLVTAALTVFLPHRPKTYEGGASVTYTDQDGTYELLVGTFLNNIEDKQPEEKRTLSLSVDETSYLPAMLGVYRNGTPVDPEAFLAKVERCTLEAFPNENGALDIAEPRYNEMFSAAVLETDVVFTGASGTNELVWTLTMKNGDTIRLKHTFEVLPLVHAVFTAEDTPLNTIEDLKALLDRIDGEVPADTVVDIYLPPVTYTGDLHISSRAVNLYGCCDGSGRTVIKGSLTVSTHVPDKVVLHDLDFERYPDQHCIQSQEIMRERDLDERLIHATASHGYGITVDIQPEHEMEKVLFATDELTGLIGAAALMRPSKSVQDMELKSLKKKYKSSGFAAGCSREVIQRGADMLGWSLDELLTRTLDAMRVVEPLVAEQEAKEAK